MVVWQCDSYKKTCGDAVQEFCNTYWDKPRKHTKIKLDGSFKLRDGEADYQCVFIDNIPGLWRITKF